MKFVFFGTDSFSSAILEKLLSDFYYPELVVTMPDKPVGRKQTMTPPAIKHVCEDHGLSVIQPEKLTSIHDELRKIGADFFIVASYGKIIPAETLSLAASGAINVHTSLLPNLRGPSPIQQAILNGLEQTGISLIRMDEKMDHGPVYLMNRTAISPDETYRTLHSKLAHIGAETLAKALPDIVSGNLKPKEQNHDAATFTAMITKDHAKIDWSKPAEYIERMVRAYYDWPIAWTTLPGGKRCKILKASVNPAKSSVPGRLSVSKEQISIETGEGSLVIHELQVEGGKALDLKGFAAGYHRLDQQICH